MSVTYSHPHILKKPKPAYPMSVSRFLHESSIILAGTGLIAITAGVLGLVSEACSVLWPFLFPGFFLLALALMLNLLGRVRVAREDGAGTKWSAPHLFALLLLIAAIGIVIRLFWLLDRALV